MDILGGMDYEFPPDQFFHNTEHTSDVSIHKTLLNSNNNNDKIHKRHHKPLLLTTSQTTNAGVGDMLDPTIAVTWDQSTTLSPSWWGAAVCMGTASLLAILMIAYKRCYKAKTHLHVDADEPLLGRV